MRNFETTDLWLTGFIKTLFPQIKVDLVLKNNRIVFVFPVNDDLFRAISSFNMGEVVSGLEYSHVVRRLRSEMISRKATGVAR